MSLFGLAWRFLWSRSLVTILTLLGVMLGAALISAVLTMRAESERATLGQEPLHDMVVGAKGSPLQLILSAVQHIDDPTGNIPYTRYEELRDDPRVRSAVPIGLGDNYRGFRIVGTEAGYFDQAPRPRRDDEGMQPEPPYRFAEGRRFEANFEAVIGSRVAAETGLRIGDRFAGSHGISATGGEVHGDFPYEVVGIMAPMGAPDDRAIFATLESVWRVHDADVDAHEERGRQRREARAAARAEAGEEAPPERQPGSFLPGFSMPTQEREREVTAVLVQLESPGLRALMQQEINNDTESMAAIPIIQMLRLYQTVMEPMHRALLVIAWVVVAVASLSVLTTLYQSAERRRREIAILRAIGARRSEVFLLVLLEALFLATLGVFAGWLLGHGGAALAGGYLEARLGVLINPWTTTAPEALALAVVWAVGVAAGLIPAAMAYFRSPAEDLASS